MALRVGRVQAVEIALEWRWAPVVLLGTWLLAHDVLPAHFPTWEVSTSWVTAAAAVLSGEVALLLHELAHAWLVRARGQQVTRIVFRGFHAQTIVDPRAAAANDVLAALAGPAVNLALAAVAMLARVVVSSQGPLDAFLLIVAVGNLAAGLMSLLPVGSSDGARAVDAARRTRLERQVARQCQDQNDDNQQAQRRPAVVAPTAGAAVAATQQCQQQENDENRQKHAIKSSS